MLARLVFGLVLGLLMYMPRPRGPESNPPGLPPGADELPPDGGLDVEPIPLPMPDVEPMPPKHYPGPMPSVPPTPPPGYEGEWPPASERPDAPPTPPPGHDGPWPGREKKSIIDVLRGLIDQLQRLDPKDAVATTGAKRGAEGV
jgi:hypothetical protein